MLTLIEFIFWCLMAPATIYVKKKTGKSISSRVQDFLPKYADYIVMIIVLVLVGVFFGLYPMTIAIRYLVLGHWLWSEE